MKSRMSVRPIISPCKDCNDRVVNCHSSCDIYKEYLNQVEVYKTNVRDKKYEDSYYSIKEVRNRAIKANYDIKNRRKGV